jgi:outer membrane translocation and assembly module TamA
VSFEGSLELRVNTFRQLHNTLLDPIWFVAFVDYGNVWQRFDDLRLDQVAVAFGGGIRYDTFFGPFRLDVGWRLYDPAEVGNSKWITRRPFFKNLAFHFGIGHAF